MPTTGPRKLDLKKVRIAMLNLPTHIRINAITLNVRVDAGPDI